MVVLPGAPTWLRPTMRMRSVVMVRPSFFFSAPEIAPRIVCFLCRHRHKKHYADVRIMPTCVSNPAWEVGIAVKEAA